MYNERRRDRFLGVYPDGISVCTVDICVPPPRGASSSRAIKSIALNANSSERSFCTPGHALSERFDGQEDIAVPKAPPVSLTGLRVGERPGMSALRWRVVLFGVEKLQVENVA